MPSEGRFFKTGKVPSDVLRSLLQQHGPRSRRVLTGPAIGEDAAAVLTSLPVVVAATDPVSAAVDRIGWYVVHVNANDVATRGAEPLWFLLTLLLPEVGTTSEMVENVFAQVAAACKEVGAELIGGHTEVTPGLDRPLAVGTMLGETTTFRLTATHGARAGDALVLAGPIAIEGTALLARERPDLLRGRDVPDPVVARARDLLDRPGISVLPAARFAMRAARPHAMHDVTEGGLTTALHELASAAGVGVRVFASEVPILEETRVVCDALGLDPWCLIGSGALLLSCDTEDVEPLLRGYAEQGITAARIGLATAPDQGIRREGADGHATPFVEAERDEVVRALEMRQAEGSMPEAWPGT